MTRTDRQAVPPVPALEQDMANTNTRPARVVVLGHSFITRVIDFIMEENITNCNNFGVCANVAEVTVIAEGGKRLAHVVVDDIMIHSPDLVYVELGTCDITDPGNTGRSVGRKLYELALALIEKGVKKVVVGEIVFRVGAGVPENMPEVNDEISRCNEYLMVTLYQQDKPELCFWRHKNVWNASVNLYSDGTHFNRLGTRRLYRSIRGAIFKFVREIKPAL